MRQYQLNYWRILPAVLAFAFFANGILLMRFGVLMAMPFLPKEEGFKDLLTTPYIRETAARIWGWAHARPEPGKAEA